jgi:hypothetical protein
MEPLACSTIVYRAMSRKKWVDKSTEPATVLPAAFIRRPPPADVDGLSVDSLSAESCISPLRESFGAASLHVGRIRGLGLDVVIDHAPHANIVGIPLQSEDLAKVERLAG